MPVDVKSAVASAFLEMAARKDVDKITVKDLVEACGISRQTFYYHFRDIVDVLEWTARQGVERLLAQSLKAPSPREALKLFVNFAAESQPMVRRLLNSQRREAMERIMVETDAPYMAPTPFRGKRCDSRYVYRTAETIADIKGLTRQEVEEATTATGKKLFGIPDGEAEAQPTREMVL